MNSVVVVVVETKAMSTFVFLKSIKFYITSPKLKQHASVFVNVDL